MQRHGAHTHAHAKTWCTHTHMYMQRHVAHTHMYMQTHGTHMYCVTHANTCARAHTVTCTGAHTHVQVCALVCDTCTYTYMHVAHKSVTHTQIGYKN
jgi:hypothetical protein